MEIAASVLEVFALWKEVLDKKTSVCACTADASIHTEEKTGSKDQETDARRTLHPNRQEWRKVGQEEANKKEVIKSEMLEMLDMWNGVQEQE